PCLPWCLDVFASSSGTAAATTGGAAATTAFGFGFGFGVGFGFGFGFGFGLGLATGLSGSGAATVVACNAAAARWASACSARACHANTHAAPMAASAIPVARKYPTLLREGGASVSIVSRRGAASTGDSVFGACSTGRAPCFARATASSSHAGCEAII